MAMTSLCVVVNQESNVSHQSTTTANKPRMNGLRAITSQLKPRSSVVTAALGIVVTMSTMGGHKEFGEF